MPSVFSRAVTTMLLGFAVLAWTLASFAADKTDTPAKDDSDSVFGLSRVWKIHLHVSAANWKAMQPPAGGFPGFGPGNFHASQILTAADTDKDQKLSQREFLDLSNKWLREWDKDKNGSLDEDEIKNGLNDALGLPLLKAADANNDKKVSKDEWAALFTGWFKQWDKNKVDRLDNADLIAGLTPRSVRRVCRRTRPKVLQSSVQIWATDKTRMKHG